MTQLALIEGTKVHGLVTANRRVVLPNGKTVMGADDRYDDGTYRLAAIATPDPVPDGKRVTGTVEVVGGVPIYTLEDIPEEALRPIPARDFFEIAIKEFGLDPDELRVLAGQVAHNAVSDGGGSEAEAAIARKLALNDFDRASEINPDNPLFLSMLPGAQLTLEQAQAKWRQWQAGDI